MNLTSRTRRVAVGLTVAALALVAVACSDDKETVTTEAPTTTVAVPTTAAPTTEAPKTIVEIAAGNPDFSLLVEAVTAAELVDTLNGAGPFTVFAPTNAAFEAALAALNLTKEQLFADKELLTAVLTYHVVAGKVLAADVVGLNGQEVATVQGGTVKVTVEGETVKINDATVVAADIVASNGVVHVIDKVLVPTLEPKAESIATIAKNNPELSLLVEAVAAAGLVAAIEAPGPFTVFAPTNAAFEAALKALNLTKDQLFADRALLTKVLTYHVLSGKVLAADAIALDGKDAATLGGGLIKVTVKDGKVLINDATVTTADVIASNGVIHIIDKVLLPPA